MKRPPAQSPQLTDAEIEAELHTSIEPKSVEEIMAFAGCFCYEAVCEALNNAFADLEFLKIATVRFHRFHFRIMNRVAAWSQVKAKLARELSTKKAKAVAHYDYEGRSPVVSVVCENTGEEAESYGHGERSLKRSLALLKEAGCCGGKWHKIVEREE
jgi:hypothetical protein